MRNISVHLAHRRLTTLHHRLGKCSWWEPVAPNVQPPLSQAIETKPDVAHCKLFVDLWVHQNTLLWGRLQVLYWVQVGFLGVSALLKTNAVQFSEIQGNAYWPCLIAAGLCGWLFIVMRTDKKIRDIYRRKIETFGLDIYPASVPQTRFEKDKGARISEWVPYVVLCFGFAGIDLWVATKFGWKLGPALIDFAHALLTR